MDEAALGKIRQLREVAAVLRLRAKDMVSGEYLGQILKSAEELESMASSLEQQVFEFTDRPEKRCACG